MSYQSSGVATTVRSGIELLSTILLEVGILGMLSVWTVIWYYMAKTTASTEGPIEGIIVGVYTLLPVLGILLWRLSARTGFDMPGLTDVLGGPEHTETAAETTKSQVAQRFETGE